MDNTAAFVALRRDVDELDEMLRGDGNGKPGLVARVRTLEQRDSEVRTMLQEWNSTKAQLKGARTTLIVVGLLASALGGGLGLAILSAVGKIAAALP